MILPLEIVLWYLAIGLVVLGFIFAVRVDMRSILWGVLTNMQGFHTMLFYKPMRYVAIVCALVSIWFIWFLVALLAIRRIILKRPNVSQGIDKEQITQEVAKKTVEPSKPVDGTVTKAQVQQLEKQLAIVGSSTLKGQLKTTLRKKAIEFIREKKPRMPYGEVTVEQVLEKIDQSPEFLDLCERIGYPRSDMVKMCIELGAVEKRTVKNKNGGK